MGDRIMLYQMHMLLCSACYVVKDREEMARDQARRRVEREIWLLLS